jgi:hypothetical protein
MTPRWMRRPVSWVNRVVPVTIWLAMRVCCALPTSAWQPPPATKPAAWRTNSAPPGPTASSLAPRTSASPVFRGVAAVAQRLWGRRVTPEPPPSRHSVRHSVVPATTVAAAPCAAPACLACRWRVPRALGRLPARRSVARRRTVTACRWGTRLPVPVAGPALSIWGAHASIRPAAVRCARPSTVSAPPSAHQPNAARASPDTRSTETTSVLRSSRAQTWAAQH